MDHHEGFGLWHGARGQDFSQCCSLPRAGSAVPIRTSGLLLRQHSRRS